MYSSSSSSSFSPQPTSTLSGLESLPLHQTSTWSFPLAPDSTPAGSTTSDRSSAVSNPPLSRPIIEPTGYSGTGVREGIHAQVTCLESTIAPERNITRIESQGRLGDGPM